MLRPLLLLVGLSIIVAGGCSHDAPPSSPPPAATPAAAALPSIEPIIKRLATHDGASDSIAEMRLTVETPDGKRDQLDFRLQQKYGADAISTFLNVTAPREESDKALLAVEKTGRATEAFSYLAGLKKVARLTSASTLSFRQTKVSVQELLRLELGQYRQTASERVREGDQSLLKYTLESAPERTLAFRQIVAYFREDEEKTPAKFELFDDRGRLQKTMLVEEVKPIDGRRTITRLSIDDQAQNRRLRLDTRTIQYNRRLSDKVFTEANLVDWTTGASRRLLGSP